MSRHGGRWGVVAFGALLDDAHTRALLAGCATPAERMALVDRVREAASLRLADAAARLGASVADLADDDRAVVLCLALGQADASPAERRAAALLRACVLARELGDVGPYADMAKGGRHAEAARAAASKPRPNRADPLRAAILEALAPLKRSGDDFKSVMRTWERHRIASLRLTPIGADAYEVADEDSIPPLAKNYTWASLRTLYGQSDKPRR